MTGKDFTLRQGGHWFGTYGVAPCPVCQPDRFPGQTALTVADRPGGGLLLHCKKSDCAFRDILSAAGLFATGYSHPERTESDASRRQWMDAASRKSNQARKLWDSAMPIGGTPAEAYLRSRGINCNLSDSLRFHPACRHPSGAQLPAMIALVEGSDLFAVHRTYLLTDGRGKAAVEPAKAMLGGTKGGAVRLWSSANGCLVVAEGIETALSVACGLLRGPFSLWSALSASGMRGLSLPCRSGKLTVCCDGDGPGKAAGRQLADRAIAAGWEVFMATAPDGSDFNDMLVADRKIPS